MAATQLINGISLGFIYALIALGYTLVFGVLRMVNFAHCDVMMIGAYVGYFTSRYLGWGLLPSMAAAILVCSLLGIAIHAFVLHPLQASGGVPLLTAALGVSLILEYGMMAAVTAQPRAFTRDFVGGTIRIGDLQLPRDRLLIVVVSLLMLALLQWVLTKTRAGRGMRACGSDPVASTLCGVRPITAGRTAFLAGSAMAAVAGVLYGGMFYIHPLMGAAPGLKAFCAAVIGGIGSIPGAVLGGITLGLAETFAVAFLPTAFKDAVAFVLLIAVLLLRPRGMFGREERT